MTFSKVGYQYVNIQLPREQFRFNVGCGYGSTIAFQDNGLHTLENLNNQQRITARDIFQRVSSFTNPLILSRSKKDGVVEIFESSLVTEIGPGWVGPEFL